jgi:hypothetical protein
MGLTMRKVAPGFLGVALGTAFVGCGDGDRAGANTTQSIESVGEAGTSGGVDGEGSGGTGAVTSGETSPADATSGDPQGEGSSSSGVPADEPIVWDIGNIPDAPDIVVCGAPDPVTCDDQDDDPWHALGLNCPGGPEVDGVYNGDAVSIHVHEGDLGTHAPPPFPPREGTKFVILSSGEAADLLIPGGYASTDIDGYVDGSADLPAPLTPTAVSATEDCVENQGLVGTGDCSNTIEEQWEQGDPDGAYDYNEMRINVEVPAATFGFSYDFAMFSTEYPVYYQTEFNDMYIAWLESEAWTGNISFDEAGNPISLNAGFLDYKDAPNDYDCPAPCTAPELDGTAMQGHAGTKWLTTTAPVTPGEQIELVFAIFDLSDPILDTVILLDNWLWSCEGGPPVTIPG